MKHTLGTGAKATGVAKSTILKAIKSGKISADRDANGSYAIDPAELHRVFPPLAEKQRIDQEKKLLATPPPPLNEQAETAVLLAKLAGLEAILTREQETVADLRNRLNQSEQERRDAQERLTALLTDQRLKPAPEQPKAEPAPAEPVKKKRWWQ